MQKRLCANIEIFRTTLALSRPPPNRLNRRGCSQSELQSAHGKLRLGMKNVVKLSVTKFKPIFPGKFDRKFATKKSTTFVTPKISKFHHLELLGPPSCKKGSAPTQRSSVLPLHLVAPPTGLCLKRLGEDAPRVSCR